MGNSNKKAEVFGNSIFDFTVEGINGEMVSLEQYKGKRAYVVVNTASQ
jgi:glutathione peroxidase-family protein